MLVPASSLLTLKKFPLGRAEFALRQVGARALARDFAAIAALATMAAGRAPRDVAPGTGIELPDAPDDGPDA